MRMRNWLDFQIPDLTRDLVTWCDFFIFKHQPHSDWVSFCVRLWSQMSWRIGRVFGFFALFTSSWCNRQHDDWLIRSLYFGVTNALNVEYEQFNHVLDFTSMHASSTNSFGNGFHFWMWLDLTWSSCNQIRPLIAAQPLNFLSDLLLSQKKQNRQRYT